MSLQDEVKVGSLLKIRNERGDVVQTSKNLRGLITRAHKVGVAAASVSRNGAGGWCYVTFKDRSYCYVQFADFTVARDFFRARWKKWGLYAEVRNSDTYWSFI